MDRIVMTVFNFFFFSDDEFIKKVLFSLKYRTERAKLVIDNFYTVKETFPQIYTDLDPTTESFQKHVNAV